VINTKMHIALFSDFNRLLGVSQGQSQRFSTRTWHPCSMAIVLN
jgi:hypothetical protein